jgi:hypothetical protein
VVWTIPSQPLGLTNGGKSIIITRIIYSYIVAELPLDREDGII